MGEAVNIAFLTMKWAGHHSLRLQKLRIPLSPKSNYKGDHDLPITRR